MYYLPKNASWEVLYLEFSVEAENFRKQIVKNAGSEILKFSPDSKSISLLWELFYAAKSNEIYNIFECSKYA